MRLRTIGLRNWKSYGRMDLRLPGDDQRNVVVVEGNNGAGKTSLLEAITFGLFGRAGLQLVARASGLNRSDQSYDGFLERALNVAARGQAARMSVRLEFERDGDLVGVERSWHFTAAGRHRRDEEEVRLFDGPDLDFVLVPPPPDTAEFVRDFTARRLLSEHLAGFFLLDGEHLERLAGQSVDEQIWAAVEAVLGAPALRRLAADLRDYSRERRRAVPVGTGDRVVAAVEALAGLEADERGAALALDRLVAEIAPLRRERDEIVRRIGALRGDSYRNFKALFEERESTVRARDEQREELRRQLAGDVALALAGSGLRTRAIERLEAEDQAERWEASSAASRDRFADFLEALRDGSDVASDPEALRAAWDRVWSRRPSELPADLRHGHLGEADRRAVRHHLERLSDVRAETVAALSRNVSLMDGRIEDFERQIGHQRGVDEESQGLADALTAVQERMAVLEAQHAGGLERLEALRASLSLKRQEVDGMAVDGAASAPTMARAARAERFASLAERLIEAALPGNLSGISDAVTRSYVQMAHKSVVRSIRIRPEGPVQLLDDEGEDVRRVDASAGESQIFALAVMAGLAGVAGDFPFVMDTPLARLDPVHRRNVLTHFAGGARQLILLTHPAELGPEEMAVIGPRLAGIVRIGQTVQADRPGTGAPPPAAEAAG
jgi:DNA sulfur modification protein DndD